MEQTPWKHTAVYPRSLVTEMLDRVELKDGDIIIDPFAGTGTTAVAVKEIRTIYSKRIYSIMIERGDEFINIIKERANIKEVINISDVYYSWDPVVEDDLPKDIKSNPILKDKNGEVYISKDEKEFLSKIKGINTKEFKEFHRENALYFFGVKNWTLETLYYIHAIYRYGYVLRNMLIIYYRSSWYPIFMFARNSKKVAYKFYLDRVRIEQKTKEERNWQEEEFIGMKVRDISGKVTNEGYLVKVLDKYLDSFPKIVIVQWNGKVSIEFVVHPQKDDFLMEGLKFICPKCHLELTDPYDPIGDNKCSSCNQELWKSLESIPFIQETKGNFKNH